jgi:hypothetical protein
MPDQTGDTSVADIFYKTVVLSFDLAGAEIANSPKLLEKALQSPEVDKALRQQLSSFALQNAGKTQFNSADAQKLGQALLDKAGGKLSDAVLKQIQDSSEYKSLQKAIQDLERKVRSTPSGAWIDHHKYVLYIAAAVIGVGGAAVLYVAQPKNKFIDFAAGKLDGKQVDIVKVGGVKLGVKLGQFQPSTRTVGGSLTAAVKLSRVDLSFRAGIVAVGPKVDQIKTQVVVKTHQDVTITADASGSPDKKTLDLGLGVGITGGHLPGPLNLRLGVVLDEKKRPDATLSASLDTRKYGDFGLTMQTDGKNYQGLATWSIPFP